VRQLRRDWYDFWFRPVSPGPLGLFRLVFGFWVLVYGLLLWPDRYVWFSERGAFRAADAIAYDGGANPWLTNLFLHPGADLFLTPLFVLFLLAALGLCLGWWTRLCSILVYAGLFVLHARCTPICNSGDTVMIVLSAYLALSPAGAACSLDRLRRIFQGREDEIAPRIVPWAQRLMQLQIAVLYLCASLSKAGGAQWMDGTAAYYPLHLAESVRFPTPFTDNIYLINLLTWATVGIEMSLATFVWVPRLRLYVLALGTMLHLGIEYTLNIPLFSALMITSYLNFLTEADLKNFLAWAKRPLGLKPLRLVYDGECDFCKSSLLVVYFLDIFKQITLIDAHNPAALAATGVVPEDAAEAAYAVRPDGRQFAGFDAFRQVSWVLPVTAYLSPLLYIPPVPQLGRLAYTWIKDNRARLPVAPRYRGLPPPGNPLGAQADSERETLEV